MTFFIDKSTDVVGWISATLQSTWAGVCGKSGTLPSVRGYLFGSGSLAYGVVRSTPLSMGLRFSCCDVRTISESLVLNRKERSIAAVINGVLSSKIAREEVKGL